MPERIRHRRFEIATLREHAARKGVALPAGDILDHELPFLNYRLGALKLGLDYEGRDSDSVAGLLVRAGRAILAEDLPARQKAAHLAWFLALGLAPRPVAARLLWLRFNRASLKRAGRPLFGRRRRHDERRAPTNVNVNVDADADASAG
jgi:hypothetical protein